MYAVLLTIFILVCLVLVIVVLLQSSKGGGLAGAFGGAGGAPQQLLGSRGMTTLLHKVTIYCAVGFFVTSFSLFISESTGNQDSGKSIVGEAAQKGELDLPVTESPFEIPADAPSGQESDDGAEDGDGN